LLHQERKESARVLKEEMEPLLKDVRDFSLLSFVFISSTEQ
jgi:hypothetical protein